MKKLIMAAFGGVALSMACLLPVQALAQGYDGLFAAEDNYREGTAQMAPAQESYDSVLAPSGDAEAGAGYGDALGIASMPSYGADGTAMDGDDFNSLIVTGDMKGPHQIRESQRQSLEEAKKKRLEETRRINAEAKAQRDLARQEKARKQAELDRQRQAQALKQAQERARK